MRWMDGGCIDHTKVNGSERYRGMRWKPLQSFLNEESFTQECSNTVKFYLDVLIDSTRTRIRSSVYTES
jgi:hypothetical protein